MATLQNSMLTPSAAPESDRTDWCVACKKQGYQIDGSWYTDTHIDVDYGRAYLAGDGETLVDADDTPMGWVCSLACRSQAMYERANDAEKEVLRKVMDACRVIEEDGFAALVVIRRCMLDDPYPEITAAADGFLAAIHFDDAKWCSNA